MVSGIGCKPTVKVSVVDEWIKKGEGLYSVGSIHMVSGP
jgi:hypothetical protein